MRIAYLVGCREGEEEAEDDMDRMVVSEDFADLLAAALGERVQAEPRVRLDLSRDVVIVILVGVTNDGEVRTRVDEPRVAILNRRFDGVVGPCDKMR